jgi:hypothetical protein
VEHPGRGGDVAAGEVVLEWSGPVGDRGPPGGDLLGTPTLSPPATNLAAWTGEAGEPGEARRLFAALLPDVERVLGPGHPDTLTTKRSLEYWTKQAD